MMTLIGCPGPDDPTPSWQEPSGVEAPWLLNTWGRSGADRYLIGGSPEQGYLASNRSGVWQEESLGVDVPLLNWMQGWSEEEAMFIVGNGGTVLRKDPGAQAWSIEETPTDQDLWGVWGASPDDVWAVGGSGRATTGEATVLRRNASGVWSAVALPELERPQVFAVFKVWGTSVDNVYFVGQSGLVLHWDGSELREELVGVSDDLIALWGTDPDRIALVGGRGNGVIVTWDGTEWHKIDWSNDFPLPGLNGVWMSPAGTMRVVGLGGTIAAVDFETGDYLTEPVSSNLTIHAIHGTADGQLTAVGGNLASTEGPYQGFVVERRLGDQE